MPRKKVTPENSDIKATTDTAKTIAKSPVKTSRSKATTKTTRKISTNVSKSKTADKTKPSEKSPVKVSRSKEKAKDQFEKKEITATQYFKVLKKTRTPEDEEKLKEFRETSEKMMHLFEYSGQISAQEEMKATVTMLEKQIKAVQSGYNYFIYKKDLTDFIGSVLNDRVKIIDLAHYERIIPINIMMELADLKTIFDELYVVYTDYTTEKEKKVEKERKEKDPILLGAFIDVKDNPNNKKSGHIFEKMYFIADWTDDYCDLTISKLAEKIAESRKHGTSDVAIYKDNINSIPEISDVSSMYTFLQSKKNFEESIEDASETILSDTNMISTATEIIPR